MPPCAEQQVDTLHVKGAVPGCSPLWEENDEQTCKDDRPWKPPCAAPEINALFVAPVQRASERARSRKQPCVAPEIGALLINMAAP